MNHSKEGVTYQRVPGIVGADVGDQHVLMNEDLAYFGLDEPSKAIWDALEQPAALDELVTAMSEQFAGDPDVIRRDVAEALVTLQEHKLIQAI